MYRVLCQMFYIEVVTIIIPLYRCESLAQVIWCKACALTSSATVLGFRVKAPLCSWSPPRSSPFHLPLKFLLLLGVLTSVLSH